MKKFALFLALSSSALIANAQDAIGSLQGVSGAVSISGKNVVSRAINGTPVSEGSSILVSSSGKATLVLNNGCTVSLGANQHLNVSAKTPCAQVSASVKHLFPAYQVAQAPIGPGVMPPAPLAPVPVGGLVSTNIALGTFAGIAAVGVIASASQNNPPVSTQ